MPQVKQASGFPPCVHLHVNFNEHAVYYETAEDWLSDQDDGKKECWFEWVSPEERAKAIAADSIWTCQWYPKTPVGFCALAASSYEALMAAVNA